MLSGYHTEGLLLLAIIPAAVAVFWIFHAVLRLRRSNKSYLTFWIMFTGLPVAGILLFFWSVPVPTDYLGIASISGHIIVTALMIHFTGFLLIDPLLGVAFGVVLLWASWGILCDACPSVGGRYTRRPRPSRDHGGVGSNREVQEVHHVHAPALSSGRYVFFGHLRVVDSADPRSVLRISSDMLEDKFGFFFYHLARGDRMP